MTKKTVIALDCDGCLFDCNAYVRDVAQKTLRRKLPPVSEHKHFEFVKAFDLTADEWTRVEAKILDSHATREMLWLPDAQSFVLELLSSGYDVFFLTSHWRGAPHWVPDREHRLNKAFPGLDVVFTHNKTRASFDYLVDDKTSTCVAVGDKAILFNQPWNQDAPSSVRRAFSYGEVLTFLGAQS